MAKVDLTATRVRELFFYNAETGIFTRRIRVSNRGGPIGSVAGSRHCQGYVELSIDGRSYLAHRVAWLYVTGSWPVDQVDHINGIRTDNRFANLRDVDRAINAQNQRRPMVDNKVGLMGVIKVGNRFCAKITQSRGKPIHLGLFATKEEAHAAYVEAKRRLHPGCTI